jgi:hypothetical protein
MPVDPLFQRALLELQRDFARLIVESQSKFLSKNDLLPIYDTLAVIAKAACGMPATDAPTKAPTHEKG